MTRIFISHSSENAYEALALKQWLEGAGWVGPNDIYLDIDPEHGIGGLTRWLESFTDAGSRCEAALFLVSQAWLDSQHCMDEFFAANNNDKELVALLLEDIPSEKLPKTLKKQWQVVPLWPGKGGRTTPITAENPFTSERKMVHFLRAGLAQLKSGLANAGMKPDNFAPVQEGDGWRPAYRGLRYLEEQDAAYFFGRARDISKSLAKLTRFRADDARCIVVCLGASGSGKSSFLRAGLLPRLKRDDGHWVPLQPVRSAKDGVLSGTEGLLAALTEVFTRFGKSVDHAWLREAFQDTSAFLKVVGELRELAAARAHVTSWPILILSIDQAEELFAPVSRRVDGEAAQFLKLTRAGADAGVLLPLATIRSDNYEKLQSSDALDGLDKELINLDAVQTGEIASIIREPAKILRDAAGPITPVFAEDVVSELQKEMLGQADALPLLAMTLERLMLDYAATPEIDNSCLANAGGISSAIERAGEAALEQAGFAGDYSEQFDALKAAFVPHLVSIDTDTSSIQRGVAQLHEIPSSSRGLIQALIDHRLLVTKRKGGSATVEVAHEAVLRSWESLEEVIAEEKSSLVTLNRVLRAAKNWWPLQSEPTGEELLHHKGSQLQQALQLAGKGGAWAQKLSSATEYLNACAELDERQKEADKALQVKFIDRQRRLTSAVEELASKNRYDAAMRIALVGEVDKESKDLGVSEDPVRRASLARAAHHGRLLRILPKQPRPVTSVCFSPNSQLYATGSQDGFARLFDVATGREIAEFPHSAPAEPHDLWVNAVVFDPQGDHLITGGRDKFIRVWSLNPLGKSIQLGPTADEVRCMDIEPKGVGIAAGCSDGYVEVWSLADQKLQRRLKRHGGAVLGVAFSPDGEFLVTGGKDSADNENRDNQSNRGSVAVGCSSATNDELKWRSDLLPGEIHNVAYKSDGLYVASAGYDGVGRVWNIEDSAEVLTLQGHDSALRSITFSPDGLRLATSSGDETVRIWNSDSGRELLRLAGHQGWVHDVAFNNDGTMLGTGGHDCTARLWDTVAGSAVAESATLHGKDAPIAVNRDGTLIATASSTNSIQILHADDLTLRTELPAETVGIRQISFGVDDRSVQGISRAGELKSWDLAGKHPPLVRTPMEPDQVVLAYSVDQSRLLMALANGTIEYSEDDTEQRMVIATGHASAITTVAISPASRMMASSDSDGVLCFWEVGDSIHRLYEPIAAHVGPVHSVAFSPDGAYAVTAGADRKVYVWDTTSGTKKDEIHDHTDQVMDICFNADGTRLTSACRDRFVRIFNTADFRQLSEFRVPEHATAVAFHPNGSYLVAASAGGSGKITIWDTVFLAALTGEELAWSVARHRLAGATILSDHERSDLHRFGGNDSGSNMNDAESVLDSIEPKDEAAVAQLIEVWRRHRRAAYKLESYSLGVE